MDVFDGISLSMMIGWQMSVVVKHWKFGEGRFMRTAAIIRGHHLTRIEMNGMIKMYMRLPWQTFYNSKQL